MVSRESMVKPNGACGQAWPECATWALGNGICGHAWSRGEPWPRVVSHASMSIGQRYLWPCVVTGTAVATCGQPCEHEQAQRRMWPSVARTRGLGTRQRREWPCVVICATWPRVVSQTSMSEPNGAAHVYPHKATRVATCGQTMRHAQAKQRAWPRVARTCGPG